MKDIKGFEGLYAVTDDGRVWSYRKNKFLKPYWDGNGYLKVSLCLDYEITRKKVHRLVMETFKPVENMDKLDVNHLDEDKHNNVLENLTWCTRKENINWGTGIERGAQGRRKAVSQFTLDGRWIADFDSLTAAAKAVDGNESNISCACRGIYKTAKGYIWRYTDGNEMENNNL